MMTLHGVDVYVRIPQTPDLPKTFGPFKLVFISSRGTRVWPTAIPDMESTDWAQARFFSDAVVSDAQVDELVHAITNLGFQWTKTQKLFQIDGVDAFSQPY